MDSNYLIGLESKFGADNYRPLDVVLTHGQGVWVYDVEGNRYLDCLSAYSALNQGHVHPQILKAFIEQASKLTLTSRAFRNESLGLFYKEIAELTGYDLCLPMNSGAEAIETAIKLVRKWAYTLRSIPRNLAEIITFDGNFHGRTITAISASSEPLYRDYFGPFTPGFKNVTYGDSDAVERNISEHTAGILVEPIQGEAGVVVPPDGFLTRLREICTQYNLLLIADEIQTGLGRTGKLFGCDHEGVRPDILVLGKALSGGFYPVSAVMADEPIMGLFQPGEHGSTFGGNPLAATVARAALKVIIQENLIENASKMGAYLIDHLVEIPSRHIKEVRGKGLLIGVKLYEEAGGARRFCEALKEQGILTKETHENVIRFAPPLIIDKATIDWAAPRIRDVLLMA